MTEWTQRLQYPLIKEYALNYSKIPKTIYGMFLVRGIGVSREAALSSQTQQ